MFPSAINLGAVFWSHLQLAIEVTAVFSPRGLSVCDSLMLFSIFITQTHSCCSETHTAAAFQPPANYIPTTTTTVRNRFYAGEAWLPMPRRCVHLPCRGTADNAPPQWQIHFVCGKRLTCLSWQSTGVQLMAAFHVGWGPIHGHYWNLK